MNTIAILIVFGIWAAFIVLNVFVIIHCARSVSDSLIKLSVRNVVRYAIVIPMIVVFALVSIWIHGLGGIELINSVCYPEPSIVDLYY